MSTLTARLINPLVNQFLAFPPLANWAKHQARTMMIERAESIGVPWRAMVAELRRQDLEPELAKVQNPDIQYPGYYLTSFHAYAEGNLGWEPATEVEVAAYAVHSRIFAETHKNGDAKLRQSFHQVLQSHLTEVPQGILDLGCSVGMSTFALQDLYPEAEIIGLDLSPYFLAIANYNTRSFPQRQQIQWLHAAAEAVPLPDQSLDLITLSLVCHELPQAATIQILQECRRLLKPQGCLAIMDMNPQSEVYAKMPPYILTLLKSTEPYLDQYFQLDFAAVLPQQGFTQISITPSTPRHRVIVAI
ncbi:MAG: class I SAM-dependent methyltransferase [Pseudanabaenaceae cyanobacterium bins.68]|nr:class I SAM-dependent methyltransferase [Pseudanabaenaceae cyanobacterium bins.68]